MRWTEIEGNFFLTAIFEIICYNSLVNFLGSKIVPVWSWLQMGRDLFLIWFRYTTGAWKLCSSEIKKRT